VVVDCVINNYYTYRPTETAWHGLGLWSYRAKGEDARGLVEYRAHWRRVIALIKDAGARPVVVIPALDNDAFPDGSPMAVWQEAAAEEAGALGATVVDTRPIFDAAPGRWIWWEFMHPNRLGYALVARAVADALLADAVLWERADATVVAGDAGGE
jgi:sugar phosphate isomerase/epimerase